MSRTPSSIAVRALIAAAFACALSGVPVGAAEAPESTGGWVPDEVRTSSSSRFT